VGVEVRKSFEFVVAILECQEYLLDMVRPKYVFLRQ